MNRFHMLDKGALVATLALGVIGILLIRSTTLGTDTSSIYWIKQCLWLVSGLGIYFFMSHYDYKKLVSRANIFYMIGVLALGLVLFMEPINGARSWFKLPFMSVQPSEFMKIATVLVITKYFTKMHQRQSSFWEFVVSAVLIGIPVGLIAMQPDLGTALVYLPFFVIPNFLIGNKESIWVTLAGVALAALLIAGVIYKPNWVFFMKDYQKDRIIAFIYPDEDTSNKGYQVHQSKISIGQGGLFGMGLGQGKQTKMGFLPAQQTDFILAVAAEELGFVGLVAIFGLFFFLFYRGFQTALEAGDTTGSALVVLVIGTLFTQMLFNAAMLIGMVPTTGIPCPLVSYGGSSMWATMGLLGLIQSVRSYRFVNG
ncbi:MAG: rod shape-determining protein RodA [Acidobacteriota bacterium]|nr:rod shape-determining protein RodA [Acidobacteriota bacterium]